MPPQYWLRETHGRSPPWETRWMVQPDLHFWWVNVRNLSNDASTCKKPPALSMKSWQHPEDRPWGDSSAAHPRLVMELGCCRPGSWDFAAWERFSRISNLSMLADWAGSGGELSGRKSPARWKGQELLRWRWELLPQDRSLPWRTAPSTLNHSAPKKEKKKKGDFLLAWQPGNEFSHHVRAFPLHKVSVSREGRRAELTAGAWGEWRLEEQRAPPQLSGLFWLPLIISQHQQACTLLQALPCRHTIENNISYASLREIYIDNIIWD